MTSVVVLDLETFYSREFSLTKITTEHYVRDADFETIGIAIKIDEGKTVWYPQPEVEEVLSSIDWSDKFVVAQNTAFDGSILRWHYDVNPLAWLDTLGMSRALFPHEKSHSLKAQAERAGVGVKGDEVLNALGKRYADFSKEELARYGDYCINDVELTKQLFDRYMGMGFPKQELKLMDLTLRMFIDPVLQLDKGRLLEHLEEVKSKKQSLIDEVRDVLLEEGDPESMLAIFTDGTEGLKKLLGSNERFATLLRRFGAEPPLKLSPATGKPAYAFAKTDEGMQALAEHEDVRVQALAAARLGTKSTIEETRTERFIGMCSRGKFPVPLRYYGAHSGRWSGQDSVNLQNLPSRGPNAGKLKKSIVAPEGYMIVDCDSAQIEARVLAWLAGQEDLVEAFANKEDVYKIMASRIYGVPVVDIDKGQRQVGKTVILGAGYGVGWRKLQLFLKNQAGVEVSETEAKRIIDTYRETYYRIPELWKSAGRAIEALYTGNTVAVDTKGLVTAVPGKGLTLPSKLHIQYPGLRKVIEDDKEQWRYNAKGIWTRVYGGLVVENFTQAIARCVVAEQMLRIAKRYKVVLTVHDAVACIVPEAEIEEGEAFVVEQMSWRPKWAQGLPLACEAGHGKSYGDC